MKGVIFAHRADFYKTTPPPTISFSKSENDRGQTESTSRICRQKQNSPPKTFPSFQRGFRVVPELSKWIKENKIRPGPEVKIFKTKFCSLKNDEFLLDFYFRKNKPIVTPQKTDRAAKMQKIKILELYFFSRYFLRSL